MSGVFVSAIVSGALILLGSIRGNRVAERRRRVVASHC